MSEAVVDKAAGKRKHSKMIPSLLIKEKREGYPKEKLKERQRPAFKMGQLKKLTSDQQLKCHPRDKEKFRYQLALHRTEAKTTKRRNE